ncbi:MAG: conserved hypothetical protein, partial [uncultured Thermomicrobiales bacterium]
GIRVLVARLPGTPPRSGRGRAPAAGPVPDPRFPGALRRADPPLGDRSLGLRRRRRRRADPSLDLGRVPGAAERDDHRRHPLRHQVVQARHGLGGGLGRHPARRRRDQRSAPGGPLRRRVHHQRAARGRHGRQGVGGVRLRRRAARPGARRAGPPARAPPLLLEEREVGARPGTGGPRPPGLLGVARIPQLRRPLAGTAVRGGL